MYLASHSVLCHCLVKQHSRNDKKKKKKKKKIVRCQCTTKLTQVSSFSESHPSYGRARHQIRDWSESGRSRELLTPGTSDSCRPRGVITRDFSAIFDRLFDRLPVRISNSDLHHWILRKKLFHIRAYDFGVQFSFKVKFDCPSHARSTVPMASHNYRWCHTVLVNYNPFSLSLSHYEFSSAHSSALTSQSWTCFSTERVKTFYFLLCSVAECHLSPMRWHLNLCVGHWDHLSWRKPNVHPPRGVCLPLLPETAVLCGRLSGVGQRCLHVRFHFSVFCRGQRRVHWRL